MITGFRIIKDPNNPRIIHVYEPSTGLDIADYITDGSIHIGNGRGLVTATLTVVVSEVILDNNDWTPYPVGSTEE